jgi:mono/diheme cytochrome c family protein
MTKKRSNFGSAPEDRIERARRLIRETQRLATGVDPEQRGCPAALNELVAASESLGAAIEYMDGAGILPSAHPAVWAATDAAQTATSKAKAVFARSCVKRPSRRR